MMSRKEQDGDKDVTHPETIKPTSSPGVDQSQEGAPAGGRQDVPGRAVPQLRRIVGRVDS
ncbi:hypothetical protein FTUN_2280 [Frigoriglobus tundricola]|uniref:Uncharacterized protein n=1 Tax=Frigoriglobus tundricola TaxID=2774151 RepID=A0A6M5YL62_9BACT|nr:hypothetical protein FTUN_2280 [Frigoriglobus tundricola]